MKRVFISYSWDNECYKKWVYTFSIELQKYGILTYLDQKDLRLGDLLPKFMQQSISDSDYVLILCTPNYKQKSDSYMGGVGYEESIITAEILLQQNHRKYIPILIDGSWKTSIPIWASGKLALDFSKNINIKYEFNKLLKTILGENNYSESEIISYRAYYHKYEKNCDKIHFYDFQESSYSFDEIDIPNSPQNKDSDDFEIITVQDETGRKIDIHIIALLKSPENDKKFILYTFDDKAENVDIYAGQIIERDGEPYYEQITDPYDWEFVQAAIKELSE